MGGGVAGGMRRAAAAVGSVTAAGAALKVESLIMSSSYPRAASILSNAARAASESEGLEKWFVIRRLSLVRMAAFDDVGMEEELCTNTSLLAALA